MKNRNIILSLLVTLLALITPTVAFADSADDYLAFTAVGADANIRLQKYQNPGDPNLQYSLNKQDWTKLLLNTDISVSQDATIWFRRDPSEASITNLSQNEYSFYRFMFSTEGTIEASGNVVSLLTGSDGRPSTIGEYCFSGLFSLAEKLTVPPAVGYEGQTLSRCCYQSMFYQCTNLTTMPELPAATLAEKCYYKMFMGCRNLEYALHSLPATSLANSCYAYMFYDCKKLRHAPSLPATTLEPNCYDYMFYSCDSLKQVPQLPATNVPSLAYHAMFTNCKSITSAELPATEVGDGAYNIMFSNCTSLKKLTVALGQQNNANNVMYNWLSNTARDTTGVMIIPAVPTGDVKSGYNLPGNWKVQFDFEDGLAYTSTAQNACSAINYKRNFTAADKWQSLFVPFDINISSETRDLYDIAEVYMVAVDGASDGGMTEEGADVVVLNILKDGDVAKAGTPYFIRPKAIGVAELKVTDVIAYPASEIHNVDCETTRDRYEFCGVYTTNYKPTAPIWYAMNGGEVQRAGTSSKITKAQRWYLTKTAKVGGYNDPAAQAAQQIRIVTLGEDEEATAIVTARQAQTNNADNRIYSVSGACLGTDTSTLPSGIYIQGNKKFIIR